MTPEEMQLDMMVADLDYENRLLRARADRLTKENESLAEQIKKLHAEIDAYRVQAYPSTLRRREEDPCLGCRKGGVCRTPNCGRLKLPENHPYRVGN